MLSPITKKGEIVSFMTIGVWKPQRYECFGDWMIMSYVTNTFVGCCLWSHMMGDYTNLFSIEDLDDWLPRQLGTMDLKESRSRRWIKAKDMLEPSKCWLGVDVGLSP
jgi:hypothetical protein